MSITARPVGTRPFVPNRFWAMGCLLAGVAIFSLQDLIVKLISADYPVHQVMTIRSLVAMPLLLLMVGFEGRLRRLFPPRSSLLTLRGAINLFAYMTYYLGLASLPIATCVALYFTAPLFIVLLSVIVLKERVEARQWAAIFIGFVGVIILVRPGSALFQWSALLPVTAGVTYAASQIVARKVGQSEGPATMAAYSNGVFLLGASALALVFGGGSLATEANPSLAFLLRGWSWPDGADLLLMMACGLIAAAALTLLSEAYRSAPANRLAPLEYSALGWSIIYGWVFWRELPDAVGAVGIAVIIAAGLYVVSSDRRRPAQA